MDQWRQFHCDMKDLHSWLAEAEQKLADSTNANGDLNVDMAKACQKVGILSVGLTIVCCGK